MMFSRDRNDNRSIKDVARDVGHDLYHKAAKLDKGHEDGRKNWQHEDDCEWKRANEQ